MMTECYIFANSKPWNEDAHRRRNPPGAWVFIGSPETLTRGLLDKLAPRYVFFPHWSWPVPEDITDRFECVCFHMTDLPYGRGGSPLQNLIAGRKTETMISALRMTQEIDGGPIYLKRPLSLAGTAREIFERASDIIMEMIHEIIRTQPTPVPQDGEPTYFKRRRPEQSRISDDLTSPDDLYDFIRMLDCDGYPRAFVDAGEFRLFFSEAKLLDGKLTATVTAQHRMGRRWQKEF